MSATFYSNTEKLYQEAKKAKEDNSDTYLEKGSYQCDCGESFAVRLIDKKTLNCLQVFVECEACYYNN